MKITSLKDVDLERYRNVITGKSTGRGCGKTFAKLFTMFEHNHRRNINKNYIFVCENASRIDECLDQFEWFILVQGNDYDITPYSLRTIFYTEPPNDLWNRIKRIFVHEVKKATYIRFRFLCPSNCNNLGHPPPNQVFIDVTPETFSKNHEALSSVMCLERS